MGGHRHGNPRPRSWLPSSLSKGFSVWFVVGRRSPGGALDYPGSGPPAVRGFGAGPLIGPVLAIQYGYLPGLLWLVIGVCLAGAVQDMLVLAA